MRNSKAFLSISILAAGGLLSATTAMAATLPNSCVAGPWTVTLTNGPTVTSCDGSPCVTASYEITGSLTPDHVAGLMPLELFSVTGTNLTGNQIYAAGVGDPVFGLGASDKSREAFKVNPSAAVVDYTVFLNGASFDLGLVPVKIKKGSKTSSHSSFAPANHGSGSSYTEGACALAGPAVAGTNPLATTTPDLEEILGGKCKVHVHTDPLTGPVVTLVTDSSDPNCSLSPPIPIDNVTIQVGTDTPGPVELSEALTVLVGNGTCAYKQYYPTKGPLVKVCW